MKKKLSLFFIVCLICLCLTGCNNEHNEFNELNEHDTVVIYYKTCWVFDDIEIEVKDGYFYDSHDKFTVDENTIGLTIYFSNNVEDAWE